MSSAAEAFLLDARVRVEAALAHIDMGDVPQARALLAAWVEDADNRDKQREAI